MSYARKAYRDSPLTAEQTRRVKRILDASYLGKTQEIPSGGMPNVRTFHNGTGVSMRFKNGNNISMFFGEGSGTSCRDGIMTSRGAKFCPNVEVLAHSRKDNDKTAKKCVPEAHISKGKIGVASFLSPDRVAEIIYCLSTGRKPRKRKS
jgi:hypothetical protein